MISPLAGRPSGLSRLPSSRERIQLRTVERWPQIGAGCLLALVSFTCGIAAALPWWGGLAPSMLTAELLTRALWSLSFAGLALLLAWLAFNELSPWELVVDAARSRLWRRQLWWPGGAQMIPLEHLKAVNGPLAAKAGRPTRTEQSETRLILEYQAGHSPQVLPLVLPPRAQAFLGQQLAQRLQVPYRTSSHWNSWLVRALALWSFWAGLGLLLGSAMVLASTGSLRTELVDLLLTSLAAVPLAYWVGQPLLRSSCSGELLEQPLKATWRLLIVLAGLLVVSLGLLSWPQLPVELLTLPWLILAGLLLGISAWLLSWLHLGRDLGFYATHDSAQPDQLAHPAPQALAQPNDAAEAESAGFSLTETEAGVTLAPNLLQERRRQLLGIAALALSLFIWMVLPLGPASKALLCGLLVFAGLVALSSWQLHLSSEPQPQAVLCFSGPPGLASRYSLNAQPLRRLELVKLRQGGLSWLQLVGSDGEIVLPAILTSGRRQQQLSQTVTQSLRLTTHQSSYDSLALMDILLPQGGAVLAGLLLVMGGVVSLPMLTGQVTEPLAGLLSLAGCGLVAPSLARQLLTWGLPNVLAPTEQQPRLSGPELGGVFWLLAWSLAGNWQLALLTLAWLSLGLGVLVLALSRRVPLKLKGA
ncbi:hypothetical protein [Leptolyngbya sp. FACHB-261]|uniref:hypothetical protein n=1 Tax=Leptolyngbya sp. FACHB-261 TaxID=2692806 RepID=UPI00168934EB|nr:hypothetical protein [Leptolyngbya sp. FACHB-261]MBD2101487.1 hypothetical protein [Leptolyngbya sp. FACHB-261]